MKPNRPPPPPPRPSAGEARPHGPDVIRAFVRTLQKLEDARGEPPRAQESPR